MRSSTSNSKSGSVSSPTGSLSGSRDTASPTPFRKRRLRRVSWGFIGFVALYAALEILVFRNPDLYALEYRSSVGQFAELAESFRHADAQRITTIVLGDSQSKDALRPDLLAESSGRDAASLFNFSISGGKAFDIYRTYLQYADQLPNVKEAILVVNEHQINSHDMADDLKFRYYAGFRDRLRVVDWDNYGELGLGWVSKAFDMRAVWSKIVKSHFKGTLPKKPVTEVWKPGGLRAETQLEENGLTAAYAQARADGWFKEYDLGGPQTASLEALLRDLHERGIRITILQIPRSELFEEAVRSRYPAEQQAYFAKIGELAEQYGATFTVMSNEGLSLKEHFRDSNHVNPKGAAIVSREVTERWMT